MATNDRQKWQSANQPANTAQHRAQPTPPQCVEFKNFFTAQQPLDRYPQAGNGLARFLNST
jgi:hypothetical protein